MTSNHCHSVLLKSKPNSTSSHREFFTPTNEASRTLPSYPSNNISIDGLKIESDDRDLLKMSYNLPWLPVSKGNIKKLAHTRFVNSSPKSYRLMPASEESTEMDRTSFVEKSSHKFVLPVSYFLEVAKLWEISNRSELECRFTVAGNDEDLKTTPSSQKDNNKNINSNKSMPIFHTNSMPVKRACPWSNSDKPIVNTSRRAEQDLLLNVNRFLKSCKERDINSARLSKSDVTTENIVGSETRRYLSQIVSLMSKKFAFKLVNQQNGLLPTQKTLKTSEKSLKELKHSEQNEERSPRVNVFTMTGEPENNEQLVIIHIPKTKDDSVAKISENTAQIVSETAEEPNTKKRKSSDSSENTQTSSTPTKELKEPNGTLSKESPLTMDTTNYTCFYCDLYFTEQSQCARHMLTHLTSSILG